MIKELFKTEKYLLAFSRQLLDELEQELERLSTRLEDNQKHKVKLDSSFENYDQKANQLFNLLSTVIKSMKEMENAATRNIL